MKTLVAARSLSLLIAFMLFCASALVTSGQTETPNTDSQLGGFAGTVSFGSTLPSGPETNGSITIVLQRTGGIDSFSATVQFGNGTAVGGASCTAGVDFINTTQVINFGFLENTKVYNVPICSDGIAEPTEAFTAAITATAGNTAFIGPPNPITVQILAPTAANASISGTVKMPSGAALRGVTVTISGRGLNEAKTVVTGTFGSFRFEGLPVGDAYVVTVSSKRYTFSQPSRAVLLQDDIGGFDFVSN